MQHFSKVTLETNMDVPSEIPKQEPVESEPTETVPAVSDVVEQDKSEQIADDKISPDTSEQENTDGEVYNIDPAVIEKLTTGVLELFLPNLQKAKGSLNEALHNQEVLIETIQQENAKFTDSVAMKQLIDTMQQARLYHNKLVILKRDMNGLMDKSTKLKRRAVKIQQQKQKEELTRSVQHERELERERRLTAQVAKPNTQSS